MYRLLFVLFVATGNVYAQTNPGTTVCTDFQGYNYVIPLGQIDSGKWGEDSIKGGKLYFEDDAGVPVITFVPASGKPITSLHDSVSARYAPILGARGMDIVIVEYILGGTMEVYFFNLDNDGNGVVMFSTIRSSALLRNSRLLVGQCEAMK